MKQKIVLTVIIALYQIVAIGQRPPVILPIPKLAPRSAVLISPVPISPPNINSLQWPTADQIASLDEYYLMFYLKTLTTGNRNNARFQLLITDSKRRASLLKRLEDYLIVFGKLEVAPMYLEKSSVSRFKSQKLLDEFENQLTLHPGDKHGARNVIQSKYGINVTDLVIEMCQLNDSKGLDITSIFEFKKALALQFVFKAAKEKYDNLSIQIPQYFQESNLKILQERMSYLDSKNFIFYETYSSKQDFLRGVWVSHSNDVFQPWWNQDRELTGGFDFALVTDEFKWRFLKFFPKRQDNILSYQTLSLTGNGYTPYIRYRNNFDLADTLHRYDRPFSSYFLIGRTSHKLWRDGLVRHESLIQIGSLGISQGRKIQAKLHEDLTHSSQFVHGWDNQIGNGGRFIFQTSFKSQVLLFSTTNRYRTIFHPKRILVNEKQSYHGVNFALEAQADLGSVMTGIGTSLRFSTLDFLKQSGHYLVTSIPNKRNEFGWNVDVGVNYRYVIHNSLLEGIGVFNTFPEDPYDKTPIDIYVLKKDEVERNLFSFDVGVTLRWRKTSFFLREKIHQLEYKPRLANIDLQDKLFGNLIKKDEDKQYYKDTVAKEQGAFIEKRIFGKPIYGYGTIGFCWIVD